MTDDEVSSVAEAIRNGWLTMGKRTIEFEEAFARYTGAQFSVSVNSCTAGLHLSLCAIGILPGDEVIVPANTFAATAEVVRYFDAVPVIADTERDTHLLDAADFERRISPKTRAIIPVHYGGQPCDMDSIMKTSLRHGIAVIEDAAHALPSRYRGKLVGTISDLTCFSFYATKTLSTGEGGMVTTPREDYAEKIRLLRLHGISRDAWKRYSGEGTWKYDVLDAGYKYNLTDIASAIGICQLEKLDRMNDMRRAVVRAYNDAFSACDGVIPYVIREGRESCHHLYPLRLNLEALSIDRDRFVEELKERGVTASVHYIPLYRMSYYRRFCAIPESYPNSEWVFARSLSLPVFPGMTADETGHVIDSVKEILARYSK
jgi:dTDP-4-amino-4,6-dideoxygalactose transaminase